MKPRFYLINLVCMSVLQVMNGASITPSDNGYIRSSLSADNLQDASESLWARGNGDPNTPSNRVVYLRFDISGLSSNQAESLATLNLYLESFTEFDTIKIYALNDSADAGLGTSETNWTANNLTFNKRPDGLASVSNENTSTLLTGLNLAGQPIGRLYRFDISKDIGELIESDTNGEITLMIVGDKSSSSGISIASISNTSGYPRPTLTLAENFDAAKPIVDVYILSGQSNMSGRVSSGLVPEPETDSDILYYFRSDGPAANDVTSGGKFTTLSPLASGYYGPEMTMARELYRNTSNKLAIIKVTDGGTSLAREWNSRREDSSNVMWQFWLSDVADAIGELSTLGYAVNIKGIGWLQGESDGSTSANYESRFIDLTLDMCAHLETLAATHGLRFVTARIDGDSSGQTTVREAQGNVMDTNANWQYFDTLDLSLLSDGTHYDVPSNATIGERFAEAFLAQPKVFEFKSKDALLELKFFGILYSSNDLLTWQRMPLQPASPYQFSPSRKKEFFQIRER